MGEGEWNMQKENTRLLLGEVCVNNLIRKSVKLGIGTTPNFIKKKRSHVICPSIPNIPMESGKL